MNGISERAALTQGSARRVDDWRFLWPEAVRYHTHVHNRTPTKSNPGMQTPFQRLYSKKPYIGNFQLFGAIAYVHIPPGTRAMDLKAPARIEKMAPRAKIGIFVGYNSESIWRIYLLQEQKVVETRSARFVASDPLNGKLPSPKDLPTEIPFSAVTDEVYDQAKHGPIPNPPAADALLAPTEEAQPQKQAPSTVVEPAAMPAKESLPTGSANQSSTPKPPSQPDPKIPQEAADRLPLEASAKPGKEIIRPVLLPFPERIPTHPHQTTKPTPPSIDPPTSFSNRQDGTAPSAGSKEQAPAQESAETLLEALPYEARESLTPFGVFPTPSKKRRRATLNNDAATDLKRQKVIHKVLLAIMAAIQQRPHDTELLPAPRTLREAQASPHWPE
ncbi:hypothetical protein MPH_06505 [Macrophomina phaseolina MS6]|uniref:Retroviral polymerase SH3-like domain-containing protein n=1 Tax=Macrophomina phaseolina (strain MS6) TaxID=1126212 RepID=K2RU79_MACPH|nr:hypothetical protein MPH_06505 [Macrophomina phaseolina MS6]